MTPRKHAPTIACFGESLWDVLPRGIFPGGAPLNVAYHLARHGLRPVMISAVGRDFLGDEMMRRISVWRIAPRFVARQRARPTGTVRAALDDHGMPAYRIARNVAWDRIVAPRALLAAAPPPAAVVFGTLALRSMHNRRVLAALGAAWPDALWALDLNLRPPFDAMKAVTFAIRHAQMIKLNHEELAFVVGRLTPTPAKIEVAARRFAQARGKNKLCVTAGARGAGLLWDDHWFWMNARPVKVRDTIGAGDAFFGALLAALLGDRVHPEVALARACRAGEFVAGCDGATPPYRVDDCGRLRSAVFQGGTWQSSRRSGRNCSVGTAIVV